MARDKLITVRIEGEKRQAFGDLAKSQNTDTASLLYDFISGCLDGRIDISLVTGKGNRIDNQLDKIDSDRIDKLEATTQRIDERVGQISKKLTDWIEAIDDRLNDCDQGLSEKITSLEHRLNALASQLDSQQLDKIDTDSQQIDDMEQLLRLQREASIATSPLPPSPSLPPDKLGKGGNGDIFQDSPPSPQDRPAIESLTSESDSSIEGEDAIGTVTPEVSPSPPSPLDAIGTLPTVETVEPISSIELDKGVIETDDREWLTLQQIAEKKIKGLPGTHQGLRPYAENWEWRENPTKKGKQYKIPREYL